MKWLYYNNFLLMLQQCLENFQDSDLLLGVQILRKSLESLSESEDKTRDDEGWLHFALRKKESD